MIASLLSSRYDPLLQYQVAIQSCLTANTEDNLVLIKRFNWTCLLIMLKKIYAWLLLRKDWPGGYNSKGLLGSFIEGEPFDQLERTL